MCGLVGSFQFGHIGQKDNNFINQMLAIQQHRGPDDSGIIGIDTNQGTQKAFPVGEDIAPSTHNLLFAFNRLSILDISPKGHQPMISPDGSVILMMNGEVYNAFDFKDDLVKNGYSFKSTTDTEVILHLYSHYGMHGMLERLNGMFALAIYDFKLKSLFLARDRFGIKPLYLLQEKGRIAFSSEMKSFRALPDFKFEADLSALDEFLMFRNLVNGTLFKNIKNIDPGTYAMISPHGKTRFTTYYDINEEGKTPIAESNSKASLSDALANSVKRQMISDVKLGCQLSGGVDSSLVTYFASENLPEGNLETVSIQFENPKFSEEKHINKVVNQLNLKSNPHTMKPDYYFQVLEQACWHFEHPLNHPNTIGIYLLSEQARKVVTVLLSGEGADEALAGYDRFLEAQKPSISLRDFLARLRQNRNNISEFISYYKSPSKRAVASSAYGSLSSLKKIRSTFSLDRALERRLKIFDKMKGDLLLRQRKYELTTYLPDLLMRQDKMSMAHSIENRVPFLDNEMLSVSLNLGVRSLLVKRGTRIQGKDALKKICADKFGNEFAYRQKVGFGIPLREFMSSSFFKSKWEKEWRASIEKRGIFQVTDIDKWIGNLEKISVDKVDAIWTVVTFEVWAKQFLDNDDRNS
ncbi:MAG: asparagine synthase (glutamine-hydrolyzing) [Fulvivirga sp.]